MDSPVRSNFLLTVAAAVFRKIDGNRKLVILLHDMKGVVNSFWIKLRAVIHEIPAGKFFLFLLRHLCITAVHHPVIAVEAEEIKWLRDPFHIALLHRWHTALFLHILQKFFGIAALEDRI